jgi:hypothetical protein
LVLITQSITHFKMNPKSTWSILKQVR